MPPGLIFCIVDRTTPYLQHVRTTRKNVKAKPDEDIPAGSKPIINYLDVFAAI